MPAAGAALHWAQPLLSEKAWWQVHPHLLCFVPRKSIGSSSSPTRDAAGCTTTMTKALEIQRPWPACILPFPSFADLQLVQGLPIMTSVDDCFCLLTVWSLSTRKRDMVMNGIALVAVEDKHCSVLATEISFLGSPCCVQIAAVLRSLQSGPILEAKHAQVQPPSASGCMQTSISQCACR